MVDRLDISEIMEKAARVEGKSRRRTLSKRDAEDFVRLCINNPRARVRVYSSDGFVPNSYTQKAEITYVERTFDGDIVVSRASAKRPFGCGETQIVQASALPDDSDPAEKAARFKRIRNPNAAAPGGCGRSHLTQAVFAGDVDGLAMLMDKTPDIDATDENGDTALKVAVRKDRLDMLRTLIAAGADVNHKPHRHSMSPLEFAMKRGNDEAVRILLDAGADATGVRIPVPAA